MKTDSINACPKCGAAVPPEAPQGLCPRCVLAAAAAPEPAPTATSQIPSLERLTVAFPQLQIIELIGRGGMGFVFKARQPHLDRFVALKLLPDSLAHDPQFAERFNREGRVLARLNHPNIVSIFDFGYAPGAPISKSARPSDAAPHAGLETGAPSAQPEAQNPKPETPSPQTPDAIPHPHSGFYYLMMEYVDGVNLRQAMQSGRFSPAEALTIVPKICEALQFAHEEGILHRDIKPENILLDAKGRVKIADFGIAKLVGEEHPDASLTATGAALGTMHYMAPEQIEKPATVDHRADIYSLGVVFYELLTGELPLGRFGPPSAKTPVDSRVDDVVMRTLEKEREKRFQSAGLNSFNELATSKSSPFRQSTWKKVCPTLPQSRERCRCLDCFCRVQSSRCTSDGVQLCPRGLGGSASLLSGVAAKPVRRRLKMPNGDGASVGRCPATERRSDKNIFLRLPPCPIASASFANFPGWQRHGVPESFSGNNAKLNTP